MRKSKTITAIVGGCSVFVIIAVAMMMPTIQIGEVVLYQRSSWSALGAEAVSDPDTGENSGICGVWIFELGHGNELTANVTAANASYIAGGEAINATALDIPHSTNFVIIIWIRGNTTDCNKEIDYLECNLTWSGTITGSTAPDYTYQITNASSFLFAHFVWTNSDAGYSLTRDQTVELADIIAKGYK